MTTPIRRTTACAITATNPSPIKRDGHILCAPAGVRMNNGRTQVETNLEGVLHALILIDVISTLELVRRPIRQARVEPDVLLVVREAPEGYPQLKLLRNGRVDMFDELEWDVGCYALRC